eukprot:jgi/Psemu1/56011/gm1.56011_g
MPTNPTKPLEGRSSASSPKKRLQSTPSLSSSSARSASGSRYPKRAHLSHPGHSFSLLSSSAERCTSVRFLFLLQPIL